MYYLDDPKNAGLPSRIWAATDRTGDCWLWTGPRQRNGYGYTNVWKDGHWQHERVHRIACELTHGPMPAREVAMHSCDVNYAPGDLAYRRCVRPTHIHPGSQSANIQEMYDKGRGYTSTNARGEAHGNAKLSDDAVRVIRATYTGRYGELAALARQFNTSTTAILRVVSGDTWLHVDGQAEPLALPAPAPKARGERHSHAKLTEALVREIRARVAAGEVQRHLAAEYGVSVATICNIVSRKIWAHVI
jgi:hypothetical protein